MYGPPHIAEEGRVVAFNGDSEVLDALKRQVGDHFALLVKYPALRVHTGAGNVVGDLAILSIHAPAYLLKDLHEWTTDDCLQYLRRSNPKALSRSDSSLTDWLLRPELRGKECVRARLGIGSRTRWKTLGCYSRTALSWNRSASSGKK